MNNVVHKIFKEETINKIKTEIDSLGFTTKLTAEKFLLSRLLIELTIFLILILIPNYGIIIAIISIIFIHYLYKDILITSKIINRKIHIQASSYDFFSLLKLAIKSSESLEKAFATVTNNMNNSFAKEAKYCLKNIDGKSFASCIKLLKTRIPNQDIKNTLTELIESPNTANQSITYLLDNIDNKKEINNTAFLNRLPIKIILSSIIFLLLSLSLLFLIPNFIK